MRSSKLSAIAFTAELPEWALGLGPSSRSSRPRSRCSHPNTHTYIFLTMWSRLAWNYVKLRLASNKQASGLGFPSAGVPGLLLPTQLMGSWEQGPSAPAPQRPAPGSP